jgi:PAS domain S-box-containing protein
MSLYQQSSWHHPSQQKDGLSVTPPRRLELVPERTTDLEIYAAEKESGTQEQLLWYQNLYEHIPSVYITLDNTGKITSINQFGTESLGYTASELQQKPISCLFHDSEKERLTDAIFRLIQSNTLEKISNQVSNWEFYLNCPNSKIIWVKLVARILPGRNENPVILVVFEDITTSKQAEEALRESEELFHNMADTAPVMLWMSSPDGMRNFFNQYWLDFTGRPQELEQGEGWTEGIYPDDKYFCLNTYYQALLKRQKFQMEYRLRRADGEYRWILDIGVPRFTKCGNFAGYIGCCVDITEHKLAAVSLQQKERAAQAQLKEIESLNHLKDEFLSTVSHELRTPLTNMKMAIQMLGIALNQEQDFLSEMDKPQSQRSKAARYFQILNNECEREINLINNFLDLQRLDTSIRPLVLETIPIKEWLSRVVDLFKARSRSIQQNIHINIGSNVLSLLSDPFSLERIIVELLTNACKFSPNEAEIVIDVVFKNHNMEFQVTNFGVVIPAEEIPRIFEKFYRIPSNDPWRQGGTGLGLALVQKLTKYLGGNIIVESEENKTIFTLVLPLRNEVPA